VNTLNKMTIISYIQQRCKDVMRNDDNL